MKSPIFTNTPCKTACLYNAPSMHTLEKFQFCLLSRLSGIQTREVNVFSLEMYARYYASVAPCMMATCAP